jgi:hypothetical protein
VAGSCECGDEPSGSSATELISYTILEELAVFEASIARSYSCLTFSDSFFCLITMWSLVVYLGQMLPNVYSLYPSLKCFMNFAPPSTRTNSHKHI